MNLYAVLEQPLIGCESSSTRATSPEPGLRFAVGVADVAVETLRSDGLPCPPYELVGAKDIYRIGQDLQRRAFSCAISTAWTCLPAGPRSAAGAGTTVSRVALVYTDDILRGPQMPARSTTEAGVVPAARQGPVGEPRDAAAASPADNTGPTRS